MSDSVLDLYLQLFLLKVTQVFYYIKNVADGLEGGQIGSFRSWTALLSVVKNNPSSPGLQLTIFAS